MEIIEKASPFLYILTIFLCFRHFWVAFRYRKKNILINNIFIVYMVLVPMYTVFGFFYILNIQNQFWGNFLGWAVINTLFIASDSMLLEYIRHIEDNE